MKTLTESIRDTMNKIQLIEAQSMTISQDIKDEAIKLYKEKVRIIDIMAKLKIPKTSLFRILKNAQDLDRRNREIVIGTLTDDDFKDMLRFARSGQSMSSIARDYSCSQDFVKKIVKSRVSPEEYEKLVKKTTGADPTAFKNKGVTPDLIQKWGDEYATGKSLAEISKMFNITIDRANVLRYIRKLENWNEIKDNHNIAVAKRKLSR
jgi:transposase-like protein